MVWPPFKKKKEKNERGINSKLLLLSSSVICGITNQFTYFLNKKIRKKKNSITL